MGGYVKEFKKEMILDIVFSSFYTLFIGAIPIVIKYLLDIGLELTLKQLLLLTGIYILLSLLGMICSYLSQYYSWKWTTSLKAKLKTHLMNKLLNFNEQEFYSKQRDEYVSVFSNDIEAIVEQYFCKFVDLVKSFLMVIVYGIYMFIFLNAWIAFIIIITSLFTLFLPKITGKKLSSKKLIYMNSLEDLTHRIIDVLSGFTLTNSRNKNYIMNYFKEKVDHTQQLEFYYGCFKAFTIVFNGFVMYLLDVSAFFIAGLMLVLHKITLGTATASLSYGKQFIWPIRYMIDDLNDIQDIKKIYEKYNLITNRKIRQMESILFNDKIEYTEVQVHYDYFNLQPFSFSFEKGKKYLFLGPSGVGKSTLFNLFTKQILPNEGEIHIDNYNLNKLDLAYLVSGVYHGNHIYDTSVYNNLTLFSTYSIEPLNQLLKKNPNEKIEYLLKQKNSMNLSQGEKQMISLLRTYLSDTPIVLLDEAFESIDVASREYFQNLFLNDSSKTILMITHDYDDQLIQKFDEVIYLKNS